MIITLQYNGFALACRWRTISQRVLKYSSQCGVISKILSDTLYYYSSGQQDRIQDFPQGGRGPIWGGVWPPTWALFSENRSAYGQDQVARTSPPFRRKGPKNEDICTTAHQLFAQFSGKVHYFGGSDFQGLGLSHQGLKGMPHSSFVEIDLQFKPASQRASKLTN